MSQSIILSMKYGVELSWHINSPISNNHARKLKAEMWALMHPNSLSSPLSASFIDAEVVRGDVECLVGGGAVR